MFDIEENLKKLPDSPGVYIHKDKLGRVIYVGKAISLKNRVRQYFRLSKTADPKVRALAANIEEFEYITCATEMEALILECNLIKKYTPKYNVLLRDDKTYPYIKVTIGEKYPRVLKTRRVEHDGSKYFGPYSDARAVNEIVDLINDLYTLKRCSAVRFPETARPCLNYHIGKCSGICSRGVNVREYRTRIESALEFLSGRQSSVLRMLQEKMEAAAEKLDFESAAKYRDQIAAASAIAEMQRVVILGAGDMDLVLCLRGTNQLYAVVFYVRDGKLSGRESFSMQADETDANAAVVEQFIKQYYGETGNAPKEILIEEALPEQELVEEYLSEISGRSVRVSVPRKGDKKALLDLARRDVTEMAKTIDERTRAARERGEALSEAIGRALADLGYSLPAPDGRPYRAEAYDISNTNGVDSVGAMVVYEGAKPVKKDYRRFKIRTVEGPNDYGSLQEVIYRRFRRAEAGDPGFSHLPDFLLMDGGRGQVSAVRQILAAMKIDIPVIGMAKDDHHRTRALVSESGEEIELSSRPLLFRYVGTVQEEVHRFAIEYHRGIRGKKSLTSVLDGIPGIGPAKRNALLLHFGSVENIKKAGVEQLTEVPGITKGNAEKIREYFD